ncbi:Protein SPT2 -like protein SPT2 domain-containing protein 1 [Channa argus]|uniref:Protein SPT2 homolog n=1 Tax=Channa argus TaxID=215402 RepID=A0A6G1PFG4_CHAAH|nr:Protein SPT2 -like protein SPT2 domain-containing protein 1 [Channa argus]KAK2918052.1 hypothetical protein Q8A73_004798 [Channa argus]
MMDFDNILNIASQNQGLGTVQKRYSLQAGPPKKDPKSKGVNPAAVQALLKKQYIETKSKELQMKKQKDELLAKRVELKSDRKARAMASRTKDNFRGYNGIPVVEGPKKRKSDLDMEKDPSMDMQTFSNSMDPEDDEDNYEYQQTDSEPEQEAEQLRPGNSSSSSSSSSSTNKFSSKSTCGQQKSIPPPMNFADLLRLAEKKQFEPVELKPKVAKKEERLRTADEIRELEMERKAKRQDKDRDSKAERGRDGKSQCSSSSVRKNTLEKEQKNSKPQKNSLEKTSGPGKKLHSALANDKEHLSSKHSVSHRERERPKMPQNDRDRCRTSLSSSSGAINSKVPLKATSVQVSAKQVGPKPSSSHKSSTSSDLSFKKESSSLLQGRASGIPGSRPPGNAVTGQRSQHGSSQQTRPVQGSSLKQGSAVGGHKPGRGEPPRSGMNSAVKSSGNSVIRPSLGGPPKAGSQSQAKPGGTLQAKTGGVPQARPGGSYLQSQPGGSGSRTPGIAPGRPGNGGPVPGRPTGSFGSGPGRPKCTVVSETISSKNVGGPRPGIPPQPGIPQRPGMPPRLGMPPRPMMNRPPGTMLPPITSAYKRKFEEEEEEYDSEMDDFIDDGGEGQEEISRHIKEIFGYDRKKYKDESDYALKFMESSWRDLQKEESRSLRLAVQEDLEEERKEELRRKNAMRKTK